MRIGLDHLCQVVPCSSIHMAITGAGADVTEIQLIRDLGIEVRVTS
jgi:hypothetical protein